MIINFVIIIVLLLFTWKPKALSLICSVDSGGDRETDKATRMDWKNLEL